MKIRFSIRSKVVNIALMAVLGMSFVFPPSGIDHLQEKSISDQGVALQQQKPKESLQQLINLINAVGVSGNAVEDTSNLKKMDSHLLDLAFADLSGMDVVQAARSNALTISDDRSVLMDIYINDSLDQAVTQLKGMGMQVMATNDSYGGVVEGYLPVDSLISAVNLGFTKALIPVMAYGVNTGSVTSEGDIAHNGPTARALGPNGAGVVVGIISDSMNQVGSGVVGSQGTGDLPASVIVLSDQTGGSDEGRAMAEIIYDTAPGITSMYFSSGTTAGAAAKAASINNLVSQGVDIIADDIYFINEPFFQDGMIAQAVDNAYRSGVAYFASAGNRARQSYESNFHNNGASYHDFDPNAGTDPLQTIATIPDGGSISLILQWDDPWGAATHDFDFYLFDTATSIQLTASESDNIFFGLPIEGLYWVNNTGFPVTVGTSIFLYAGSDTAFLKYINLDTGISEYDTASDTIDPDAASAIGAMTVAAVNWSDFGLNDVESFSSRGPVTRLFNSAGVRNLAIRQKPDIAGADGVSTSFGFGGGSFYGTSAAAPSVAGVAALILSDWPTMPADVLYTILRNPASTLDCSAPGNPDDDCGYGFVLADNAINAARSYKNTINDTTGVFRPGNGLLYLKNYNTSGFANVAINYGTPGDYPVTGDWDGNGTATIGIYRNGSFYLRNSNTLGFADLVFAFGIPGDQPIAGDWDNDGTDTIGIFRTTTGQFQLRNSNSAGSPDMSFNLGNAGDVGIAGDWNGDGLDTTGVFRPSNGVLFMKNTNTSGFADIAINYGIPGDKPVTGDWNNDGIDTIGVYRNGQFLLRNSNTLGFADLVFALGIPGDMPIAGNWDAIP